MPYWEMTMSEENDFTDSFDPSPLTIDGVLDLHTFAPRDVTSVVEEYLQECRRKNIFEIRLIHGKGKGFQRRAVKKVLDRLPYVAEYSQAPPEAGGWGATLVRLKKEG
jgi:DNA-nicking Smr family endonuclease